MVTSWSATPRSGRISKVRRRPADGAVARQPAVGQRTGRQARRPLRLRRRSFAPREDGRRPSRTLACAHGRERHRAGGAFSNRLRERRAAARPSTLPSPSAGPIQQSLRARLRRRAHQTGRRAADAPTAKRQPKSCGAPRPSCTWSALKSSPPDCRSRSGIRTTIRSIAPPKNAASRCACTARGTRPSNGAPAVWRTFAEVHAYAFTAGVIMQFTSIIAQGITVRFPRLRMAFLEIGASWLPYYLDGLDEHWEKRCEATLPLLTKSPRTRSVSRISRSASRPAKRARPGRQIEFAGAEHFMSRPTFRTGTASFPKASATCANAAISRSDRNSRSSRGTPSNSTGSNGRCAEERFSRSPAPR